MLSVGTYNVLMPAGSIAHANPMGVSDGVCNWSKRKTIILDNVAKSGWDVVCLQEVPRVGVEEFTTKLAESGYAFEWVGHDDKTSHGVALAYKVDTFTKVATKIGEFSAPEAPHRDGRPKIRKHLVMALKNNTTGHVARVVSCHLLSPRAFKDFSRRSDQVNAVLTDLEAPAWSEGKVSYWVIGGDYNQDQFGDRLEGDRRKVVKVSVIQKALEDKGYRSDGGLQNTVVAPHRNDPSKLFEKKHRIDWIYAKGTDLISLSVMKHPSFNPWGSDHVMVGTQIAPAPEQKEASEPRPALMMTEPAPAPSLGATILQTLATTAQAVASVLRVRGFPRRRGRIYQPRPTVRGRRNHYRRLPIATVRSAIR